MTDMEEHRGGSQQQEEHRGGSQGQEERRGGSQGQEEHRGGSQGQEEHRGGAQQQEEHRGGAQQQEEHRGGSQGQEERRGGSQGQEERRGGSQGQEEHRGGSQRQEEHRGGSQGQEEHRGGSQQQEEHRGGSQGQEERRGGSQGQEEHRGGSQRQEEHRGGSQGQEEHRGGSQGQEEHRGGSQQQEERRGGSQQQEEHKALLVTTELHNSPSEARMVAIANNFQRQYSHLFPQRRLLLLCLENENGVQKFVSTTLRPTAPEHPELHHWRGCAAFVADFLSLKPLESPVNLPQQLFSPSTVLRSQTATCLEAAVLLCSLLIGADYQAFCVSGYASRELCECDLSQQECPLLDKGEKDVRPQAQHNKYTVKPKKKLQSRHLLQQDVKKDREAALTQEPQEVEERPVDPLRGVRVHCWVLVLSGSRDIKGNLFIDALSGRSYSTDDPNFLGIESVWDNYNYYVNMQDCCSDCADVQFDLEDLDQWEPVLAGVSSKKQWKEKVLERKKNRFLGKLSRKQEADLSPRVFQMPQSWSRCISISQKDLEHRYPGGKKVTLYRRAKLEKFALYLQSDGLLTRLTTYKDLSCTEVELVKEWYRDRNDHLEHREFNKVLCVTTEHFQPGRPFHLLVHRSSDGEHVMEFNSSARADSLLRRVLSRHEMTETFEGRLDSLYYRHVSFLVPDGLSDGRHIPLKKVEERFHRNTNIPASEDVARRVFLLVEGKIQLTYHVMYYATIPSKRVFIKPLAATESRRAEDFTSGNLRTFQADPSVKPLSRLAVYSILQDLVKQENRAAQRAEESRNEVRDIILSREEEENNLQLNFSLWTNTGAALAHKHCKEEVMDAREAEGAAGEARGAGGGAAEEEAVSSQIAELQDWDLDQVDIYLIPHLVNMDFPESLSAAGVEKLVAKCLQEFTESQKPVATFLKGYHKKLLEELQENQRLYQENQELLSKEEVQKYHDLCSEKALRIKVVQDRLDRYLEETPQKVEAFPQKLLRSPPTVP
ncbi:dynein regulatory complex subunit 7-like isoform X2 [Takifugu flavidus]|uniref:dynein regulatory complex subunit 7-like isoform X2 n=1 Tax=Takifugu flavidus TaxID=433684 RepID=UPI0025447732|nr:dynein regulatory complex subunit 7-like isoform X2 [Takifugu flavidus]